jgi:hypothetical protein
VPAVNILNCFELCFVKALFATLLSLAVFICCLHIDYSAWYNTSFCALYMSYLVNETCTRSNISPQDLPRAAPERPKRPLATDSLFLVRAHDSHLALPACGCDLVGSIVQQTAN